MATENVDENLQSFNLDFQLYNFFARQQPYIIQHALCEKEYLKDIIEENLRVKLTKVLIDFNKVNIKTVNLIRIIQQNLVKLYKNSEKFYSIKIITGIKK